MTSGSSVYNATKGKTERIGRLLKMHANKREEIKEVYAGDIAAAVGLRSVTTGDTICDEKHPVVLEAMDFPEPVISLAIEPKTKADQEKLGAGPRQADGRGPDVPGPHRHRDRPGGDRRHGRAAPRDHRRPAQARVRRRGERRQAAGRLQGDAHGRRRGRGPLHQADGRARPVRPREDPPRCPRKPGEGFEFVNGIVGGVDPARVHQADRGGHPRGADDGRARGLPGRRRRHRALRRVVPRRRLVGDGVQDCRLDGVQGRGAQGAGPCCSSRSCASRWSCPRSTWAT